MISAFTGFTFWVSVGFFFPKPSHLFLLLLPGALILWANALYFQAVPKQSQSSVIIITFQLHPVFVLILSWLILHDRISNRQMLGFFLIIFSVMLLSLERKEMLSRFKLSPAFGLLAISTLSYAFATILLKWATGHYTVFEIAAFQGFGMAIAGLPLLAMPWVRNGIQDLFAKNPFRVIGIMGGNELLSQVSKLLRLSAISIGPVALVSAVSSTRVFLGVWVGALLTMLAPGIFKEDLRANSLWTKSVLSLITLAGLLIL